MCEALQSREIAAALTMVKLARGDPRKIRVT
jgi:hypothetical protein